MNLVSQGMNRTLAIAWRTQPSCVKELSSANGANSSNYVQQILMRGPPSERLATRASGLVHRVIEEGDAP